MDKRYSWLALVLLVIMATGCCPCRRGFGLFRNIRSARIAPPGTGTLRVPQVANTPAPYYTPQNNGVQPRAGGNGLGWRPAGTPLGAVTPNQQNLVPTSHRVAAVPPAQSNLQVVTGTSGLKRSANPVTNPATQGPAPNPGAASPNRSVGQPVLSGMPVNDATRVTAPGVRAQPSLLSPSLEYVVRPQIPQQVPQQPYNPNAYAVARNPAYPQQGGNAYPVPNTTQGQGVLAEGWRQRDVNGNLPR